MQIQVCNIRCVYIIHITSWCGLCVWVNRMFDSQSLTPNLDFLFLDLSFASGHYPPPKFNIASSLWKNGGKVAFQGLCKTSGGCAGIILDFHGPEKDFVFSRFVDRRWARNLVILHKFGASSWRSFLLRVVIGWWSWAKDPQVEVKWDKWKCLPPKVAIQVVDIWFNSARFIWVFPRIGVPPNHTF